MNIENEQERHQKQVDEEFANMKFKAVKIKLFPEDQVKYDTMSSEERAVFMEKIREEHRYTVDRDN